MQIVSQLYGDRDDGELEGEHCSQTQGNGMASHVIDRQKISSVHGTSTVFVLRRRQSTLIMRAQSCD